jgi:hypothetical protein
VSSANPRQICSHPQINARKLCSIYKILWHPDSFVYRDSIFGLAGRRAGALFFCSHRDYFIVTRNFTAVYLDLVPFNSFIVTLGFTSIYQDWQKNNALRPFGKLRAGSDGT